jgi:TolB-like protein/class 3 adenylate cyclase
MAGEENTRVRLEIGHVLFIDIVGYSKLTTHEQRAALDILNQVVRETQHFRNAEAGGALVKIPTGDGMALVFSDSPESPVECAIEISRALRQHAELRVRMGVHSGPVSEVTDVTGRSNLAGAGMNMAQRVMDCADAGHILLSKRVADDLESDGGWRSSLHDLGNCEVKHGVRVHLFNLHGDGFGDPARPSRLEAASKALRRTQTKRWVYVSVSLAFGALLAAWFLWQRTAPFAPSVDISNKSIAVLPFENRSEEKATEFFTDGVQDEILTNLAKIADLKVISRTSVMHYRSDRPRNLRDIGQQLGVAHVLEGSVQRAANRVRVTAQLIDARSDSHLWAEQYDGELADVFAIQSEIAQKIVAQLRARLSPKEQTAIQARPTSDTAAYDLYLRANEIYRGSDAHDAEGVQKQVALLEGAVARDPAFLSALCMLARAHLVAFYRNIDRTPARLEKARDAITAAAKVDPDAGEVHLARAALHFRGYRDSAAALDELAIARRKLPNDVDVLYLTSLVEYMRLNWDQCIKAAREGLSLDPRNGQLARMLANYYRMLRRYDEARRILNDFVAARPDDIGFQLERAYIDYYENADLRRLKEVVARVSDPTAADIAHTRRDIALYERDYAAAEAARQPDDYYFEGLIARALGDNARAEAAFLRERGRILRQLADKPDAANLLIELAEVNAQLGAKEEAERLGERALALVPYDRDAGGHLVLLMQFAKIHALLGDADRALELIGKVVPTGFGPAYGDLQLEWEWDLIRNDARFQTLVASLAPKQ